ncbi:hypothetical protein DH2020_001872 [Rehmannia glutinosa]|uniref:Reverse transcriptase zinc-binding domain-containing protein n=1 Tax=Rehmannia glutinosa TaxID=99300 RepID=A0ABR0XSP0_REHGL
MGGVVQIQIGREETTRSILAIPISVIHREDRLVWHHYEDGKYQVKLGYKIAKALQEEENSTPSSSGIQGGLWKWLWGLNIPNKEKVFLWKCVHGILPTKSVMACRGVDINPLCGRCGLEVETTDHALRDCEWNTFLWTVSPLRFCLPPTAQRGTLGDWILLIRKKGNEDGHDLFAMLLWCIWGGSNDVTFSNKRINHHQLIELATSRLQEHFKMQEEKLKGMQRNFAGKWTPPMNDVIKINSDALIREEEGTGIGVVLRDCRGRVIRTIIQLRSSVYGGDVAEALACREGMKLAKELGMKRI